MHWPKAAVALAEGLLALPATVASCGASGPGRRTGAARAGRAAGGAAWLRCSCGPDEMSPATLGALAASDTDIIAARRSLGRPRFCVGAPRRGAAASAAGGRPWRGLASQRVGCTVLEPRLAVGERAHLMLYRAISLHMKR